MARSAKIEKNLASMYPMPKFQAGTNGTVKLVHIGGDWFDYEEMKKAAHRKSQRIVEFLEPEIIKRVSDGMTGREACVSLGINRNSFSGHMKKSVRFRECVEQIMESNSFRRKRDLLDRMDNSERNKEDWRKIGFLLEKEFREEYGRNDQLVLQDNRKYNLNIIGVTEAASKAMAVRMREAEREELGVYDVDLVDDGDRECIRGDYGGDDVEGVGEDSPEDSGSDVVESEAEEIM